VWAFLVVADEPVVDVLPHFAQRAEDVGIKHFVAKAAVEAFDVAVLHGTAGVDVMEPDEAFDDRRVIGGLVSGVMVVGRRAVQLPAVLVGGGWPALLRLRHYAEP